MTDGRWRIFVKFSILAAARHDKGLSAVNPFVTGGLSAETGPAVNLDLYQCGKGRDK
jgi:hypothetical protein